MINLRYHIVSITAVFLALGIGITMGSSFLERATVDSLNSQLDSLEGRITERDEHIAVLEAEAEAAAVRRAALDAQATTMLAGRAAGVDLVVLRTEGTDDADVDGLVRSLVVAGAQVHGIWTLTDRFLLEDEGAVRDLEAALDGDDDAEPAGLRQRALLTLGGELRLAQLRGDEPPAPEEPPPADDAGDPGAPDDGAPSGEATVPPAGDPAPVEPAAPDPDPTPAEPATPDPAPTPPEDEPGDEEEAADGPTFAQVLVNAGFIDHEAVVGGSEAPVYPDGTQLVIVAGSPEVPDELVIDPLVGRLTRAVSGPVPVVVTSASPTGTVAPAVRAIRTDPDLRPVVSTVDSLDHFEGWAATVLAVADEARTIAGHYGLGEGATLLIPAQQEP